jgi:hypothetical protein
MDEVNEVDDFFERHLDDIAEAMKPKYPVTVPHRKHCTHGKRQWVFSWRWPFVVTWISNAVCCCEVNEILEANRRMQHNIDDIVEILNELNDDLPRGARAVERVDVGHLSPCAQMAIVRAFRRLRRD